MDYAAVVGKTLGLRIQTGNFGDDIGKISEEDFLKQKKMGSSLKYEHEKGIYYSLITDRLICGSCLQTAKDVDTIRDKEGVSTILCLQEDKDMAWWKLDIVPIQMSTSRLSTS